MERVVTVNLNGNPYQVEEPAFDALRAYLDRARNALGANPDKDEIVRDLEQAIADKCASYLSPGKSVVTAVEMARILDEMGPVEGDAAKDESEAPRHEDYVRPQRRLYRIYDRHAWTGVSAGLAAYAGIDVAWVRILWILSALFSGGFTIILYIVLIFAVPVASTSEEIAAANGAPFNAQEVIDRAKRQYNRVADETASSWRRERRAWRRHMRESRADWGWDGPSSAAPPTQPAGYVTRMFAGLFAFVFSIITAALLIGFLLAFFSLLGAGSLLGWTPPDTVPLWLVLVVLAIAYAGISAPFSALRRASYATLSGRTTGGAGDGLLTLILVGVVIWIAWVYSTDARFFIDQSVSVIRDFASFWADAWN